MASNFLVTLYRAAERLFVEAGAPPEALVPLMLRTIENGFDLTGPIARGDWETVDRHLAALDGSGIERLYTALAEATRAMNIVRSISRARAAAPRHRRTGAHDGRAARRPRGALRRGRARGATSLVASLFVNAAQFSDDGDLAAYPRDLDADAAFAERHGVDVLFAPSAEEMYPPGFATWVDPAGAAEGLESEHRPGHFRGVATVCLKLFNIVRPQVAWFGRKDAQQVAVLKQLVRDLNVPVEIRVVETVRDADGLALSSRNARLAGRERERAAAIPRALPTGDVGRARDVLAAAGVEPDYVAVADLDGPTLAVAARVGGIRLIDNVLLKGAS